MSSHVYGPLPAAMLAVCVAAAAAPATAVPATTDSQAGQAGLRLTGQVVTPPDSAGVILSSVAGQLELVYVSIGASVHAGERLARVYSAELPAMQRSYLHAKLNAELASSRLARDAALFKEGIIAEARLLETQSTRQIALATEREQRRLLHLAGYSEAEINSLTPDSISLRVTLRAPNSGVVLEQTARAGEHIESGMTLFRLASPGKWWLELEAARSQAAAVRLGDRVRVAGCGMDGRVIAVGGQLRVASQTLPIRAEIPDHAACLMPNQYVEAEVLASARSAGAQ